MKKLILLNCIRGGQEQICPTLKANYYKMGVANFVYHKGCGDGFLAPCVIEIETMQEVINTDSNGNAKAIRACYGQCGFDSVFRGGGQGITGVMEEVETKIVGYTRDHKGKVVKRSLRDTSNTVTTFTGSGHTQYGYVCRRA